MWRSGTEVTLDKQDACIKIFDRPVDDSKISAVTATLRDLLKARLQAYNAGIAAGISSNNLDWTITPNRPEVKIVTSPEPIHLNKIVPTKDIIELTCKVRPFRLAIGLDDPNLMTASNLNASQKKILEKVDAALFAHPKTLRSVIAAQKTSSEAAASAIANPEPVALSGLL
mmetsp:Transcript_17981/g.43703  ORF Transcript_17981/g.43703 Transcript_17981/m.43703 type:complete len:171 (-) Transcript_17981:78-590(-)